MTTTPEGLDPAPAPARSWQPGPHPKITVTVTRHHPEQQQPFGVIEQHPDGRVALHVGDRWPYRELAEAAGLALLLRSARHVEIVGTGRASIRPAKAAIQECWRQQDRAARRAQAEADGLVPDERVLCGEPTATGTRCRLRAGWGTDTPGTGPCANHGGPTVRKTAAQRRLHEQLDTVVELARKADESGLPLSPRERLAGALALREVVLAVQRGRRRSRAGSGTGEDG